MRVATTFGPASKNLHIEGALQRRGGPVKARDVDGRCSVRVFSHIVAAVKNLEGKQKSWKMREINRQK